MHRVGHLQSIIKMEMRDKFLCSGQKEKNQRGVFTKDKEMDWPEKSIAPKKKG